MENENILFLFIFKINPASVRHKEGEENGKRILKIITIIFTNVIMSIIVEALHELDNKGKAIPLQAWTGPENSRRLRLPDTKTVGTRRW